MLNEAEKALIKDALKVLNEGLIQLEAASANSKIKMVVRLIENGLSFAEMFLASGV